MYIPLMEHWTSGNVSDRYVNSLDKRTLSSHGFELLGENTKLFFDIDGKGNELMETVYEFKSHLDSLLESGKRKFVYCYSRPEDMKEAYPKRDCRKLSFHIIFEDKAIRRIGFKTEQEEETLKWLLGNFYDKLRPCVDTGVYDKNRKLRLPYHYNDDKPIELIPCDETINLTRFAVNLPPGFYKIQVHNKPSVVYDEKEEEPITEERIKKMIELLSLIKKERFQDFNVWFSLLCLMRGNKLPVKLFLQISKESGYKNYNEENCLSQWYKLEEKRTYGFPLIHKWLDEDGINWRKIEKQKGLVGDLIEALDTEGSLSDARIACIFHKYYKESLYYTEAGWIHYDEDRGWQIGDIDTIIMPLMKLLGFSFTEYIKNMKKPEAIEEDQFKKKVSFFQKEAKNLGKTGTCKSVLVAAKSLFRNDNILDEFDSKPHWFCFSDFKAIDMKTGEVILITKEDKIITTCGYPLPDEPKADKDEAEKFIRSLVEEEYFDSFMSMLSCNFYGDPSKNQMVCIHTGTGGNGKSLVGLLLQRTLANYAGILPIEQLTRDSKGRDDANSSLASMRGKRYAQYNEPEDSKDTVIKVSRLKEVSGEDKINVRELFGKSTSMKIMFTNNLFCNEKPKLSKNDGGIERRLKVFPYVYSFVENPDPEDKFQKKIDRDLSDKIKSDKAFRDGFLFLCLEHWRKNKGLFLLSDNVKEANKEYLLESNPLCEWMNLYEPSDKFIFIKALREIYMAESGVRDITASSFRVYLAQLGARIVTDNKHGHKVYIKAREMKSLSKP
tara:strand:- start:2751 stop:5090 length:2340 start_codon:yes stop_codon:yes gene_type:complete